MHENGSADCRQARRLLESAAGPDHPDVAKVLNTLGSLCEDRGDDAEAEQLYQRSVQIMAKTRGDAALQRIRVQSLSHLAGVYRVQGRYRQAEALYRRALATAEKTFGRHDLEVATLLNNLAVLYKYTASFSEAGRLYLRALAITMKVLGPEHAEVARRSFSGQTISTWP
ncbi:MAG TPA: tetratricopeptide repeat protein [Gemmataceae bacterium]|nr:tetratricopeptide repeat protein [Gemmataceae bacterium]